LNQDDELVTQFERLELNMRNTLAVVKVLCEAEGIDVSSIIGDAQHQSSSAHQSDMPVQLEKGDTYNDC
jgi:hypothetical protein